MVRLFMLSLLLCIAVLLRVVPAYSAEMIHAQHAIGLDSIGTTFIFNFRGTPQEIHQAIEEKADAKGASYYQILWLRENEDTLEISAKLYR